MNHLLEQGLLNEPLGLLTALLIGGLFGFWLERAGFGSSRKLTAIFYLHDFAVLKVMFTAMVVASLGLHGLGALGLVDLTTFYVPETVIWPQLVGGLIFGAGFLIGGWCPGTAAVGVGSGRVDAVMFLVGAGLGSLLFAAGGEPIGEFMTAGACGVCALPGKLGIDPLLGALGLAAVALVAFVGSTRVEKLMARRHA